MSIPLRVLLLEDNRSDAELVVYELQDAGFTPDWQRVETEADFLAQLRQEPDLILADYNLPGFDAMRALELRNQHCSHVPFLIVSGSIGEELAVSAMKHGASDYLLKDRLARLGQAVVQALEQRRLREAQEQSQTHIRSLLQELQQANCDLIEAYDATLEGWSRAVDLRDRETEGHSRRVTEMTLLLAQHFDIPEAEIVHMRRGAMLHDIGKLGIPDSILHKPGLLTEEEWDIMRLHPTYAYQMLSPIAFLQPALDIPYCHHESWDGSGYPRGLKGEDTPLAARIFAIADVWDALRSDRPYRPAWPAEKVTAHIRSLRGTRFDPRVVEVFLKVYSDSRL